MHELLEWQNAIFWAPMVVGALLYALSALAGGDHDHAQADIHGDVDSEITVSTETEIGSAQGIGPVAHPTQEANYHGSIGSYFGLGKVPLAAVVASLLFGWGIAGMVMNQILGLPLVLVSITLASIFALGFTRIVTLLLARYVPAYESYSQGGVGFFLMEGEALYTISDKSGTARVLDKFNNLRDLDCRVRSSERAIAKGEKIYVDDYDERSHIYFVKPMV